MQTAKCKMQSVAPTDFRPAATWSILRRRAELLRELREFFDRRGFLEVETPILSADIVVDRHLDPLSAILPDDPRRPDIGRRLWLHTSPEFAMKRLLAAASEPGAATAIYQVAHVFRAGERGRLHNPEFTMVEWYRVGDDMAAGMSLLSDLCESLLKTGPAERISYRDAFLRWVGIDPLTADGPALAAVAAGRDLAIPDGLLLDDRDAWLELLFVELVQPNLGQVPNMPSEIGRIDNPSYRAAIVYDYPASQAALARTRPCMSHDAVHDPPAREPPLVAERFELFVRGVELANGYHELLDATELRCRFAAANAQRAAGGKPRLPEESRLLAALEHGLPPCSGTALGFDRLVMLAVGAQSIDEVIAFPIERA